MVGHAIPLPSVEAFVVAARALSLAVAAERLGLTPTVVGRRIQDLERDLGVDLFYRLDQRLELSPAGLRYLEVVGEALDRVQQATEVLRQPRQSKRVRLATLPVLASAWLLPRLAKLKTQHPDIEIELETDSAAIDFVAAGCQAGIRFGEAPRAGFVAAPLAYAVSLYPICAPNLVADLAPVTAAGLDRFTFLTLGLAPRLWDEWLKGIGLPAYVPRRVQSFDSLEVLYEAAAAGMGLALAAVDLKVPQLAAGRLTKAFRDAPIVSTGNYFLMYRERDRDNAPLLALQDVLQERDAPPEVKPPSPARQRVAQRRKSKRR